MRSPPWSRWPTTAARPVGSPISACPPPGDVRRCLLALTPEPSLWSELFAHRFRAGDVAEHSLGNLILAALTDLFGDFESAVATAERMLGTVGTVIPVADHPVVLEATIDGKVVVGQGKISKTAGELTELHIEPRDVVATRRALAAVAVADQIVIGPGSLYTSIISAFKVNMLAPAIMSADAQKIFVLNLVTQDGETLGMDGADHLDGNGGPRRCHRVRDRGRSRRGSRRARGPRAGDARCRSRGRAWAGGWLLPTWPMSGQTGRLTTR